MRRRIGIVILFLLFSLVAGLTIIEASSEAKLLSKSGLRSEVRVELTTLKMLAKGKKAEITRYEKKVFLPSDKEVIWWGEFKPFVFFRPHELKAKWYEPNGRVFLEQSFFTGPKNAMLARTNLSTADIADKKGKWKLEIYYKDKLIDKKSFIMGPVSIDADDKSLAEIRPVSSLDEQRTSYLSKLWSDNTASPDKKTVAILAIRGNFSSAEGIAAIATPLVIDFDYPDESEPRIERYGYSIKVYPSGRHGCAYSPPIDNKNIWGTKRSWSPPFIKYPKDISLRLGKSFAKIFMESGYEVIDLTPITEKMYGTTAEAILEFLKDVYKNVDYLYLFLYSAYSRIDKHYTDLKVVKIGLFLYYNSFLFDTNSRQTVFQKNGQISALPERAIFGISKIDYTSDEIEMVGLIGKKAMEGLGDGVFDDEWIVNKLLDKLKGREYGRSIKVKIGGELNDAIEEFSKKNKVN